MLLAGAAASQLIARVAHRACTARMMDAFNIVLAVLVLALAVWTVVARDTFTAVVGFVAYGLLLALVWVQLHGVDVALTEAALGSGLTGALVAWRGAALAQQRASCTP